MKQLLFTIAAVVLVGCGESSIGLIEAIKLGDIELTKKALSKGADPNTKDELGSALWHALIVDHQLAQLLIDKGANVNNDELLHGAVNSGFSNGTGTPFFSGLNDTEFLINNGADVNVKDSNGRSPLHCVDTAKVAEILINAGADVNALNESKTPFDPYPFRGTPLDSLGSHFPMLNVDPSLFEGQTTKNIQKKQNQEYKLILNLLRKHGAKTAEELKAEGK